MLQVKHARTGTNRKRKRKVDYEEESDEEEAVPFACKKCGKWTTQKKQEDNNPKTDVNWDVGVS